MQRRVQRHHPPSCCHFCKSRQSYFLECSECHQKRTCKKCDVCFYCNDARPITKLGVRHPSTPNITLQPPVMGHLGLQQPLHIPNFAWPGGFYGHHDLAAGLNSSSDEEDPVSESEAASDDSPESSSESDTDDSADDEEEMSDVGDDQITTSSSSSSSDSSSSSSDEDDNSSSDDD
eukprot:jgi/Chrzof1/7779/Cz02g36130.t1